MLLEAINSVFLTFLLTEFLLGDDHNTTTLHRLGTTFKSQHSRPLRYAFLAVVTINILVNLHEAFAGWIHDVATIIRVPRIVVAITSFLLALYWDCRHKNGLNAKDRFGPAAAAPWSNRTFFRQLLQSFCRLLPVYPFVAVVISFGFLFVISIFEKLHLPLEILNMPIYYGTLYG
jgi:hypothetical protein